MSAVGRHGARLLLWRGFGSVDQSYGCRWLSTAYDRPRCCPDDIRSQAVYSKEDHPSLPSTTPILPLCSGRGTGGTPASRSASLPTASCFGFPSSFQQQRSFSWQRFVPSVNGIRSALEASDRQVTNMLIAINIATYIWGKFDRSVVISMAGIPYNIAHGEWHRLLTCGFLHTDFIHLLANMLFLHGMGPPLEAAAGRSRYAVIFLVSVLGGSWAQFQFGSAASVFWGASGGAAGLFGAYLVYRLRNRKFIVWDAQDSSWVAQMVGLNLALGLLSHGSIAQMAHLGGLLTGGAVCWLIGPRYRWQSGGVVDVPLLRWWR